MKKIFFTIAVLAITIVACQNNDTQEEVSRKFYSNLKIDIPQNIEADEQFCTKIYFNSNEFKLHRAYVDFDVNNTQIDTSQKKLVGEGLKLNMNLDTLKIFFRDVNIGSHEFKRIRVLFSDLNNNYYVRDTVYSYSIK